MSERATTLHYSEIVGLLGTGGIAIGARKIPEQERKSQSFNAVGVYGSKLA